MSFKRLFLLLTTLLFSLNVTAQQSQEQLNEQLWEGHPKRGCGRGYGFAGQRS